MVSVYMYVLMQDALRIRHQRADRVKKQARNADAAQPQPGALAQSQYDAAQLLKSFIQNLCMNVKIPGPRASLYNTINKALPFGDYFKSRAND